MPGIVNIFNQNGKNSAGPDLIDEPTKTAPRPPIPSDTDGSASTISKLGAGLAIGAAIALAVGLGPLAGLGTAVAAGTSLASGVAVVKGSEAAAARGEEEASKKDQRGTVDGLIEKGAAKAPEDRDAYFDKLQEMFPSESKRIQEQRSKLEAESAEAVSDETANVGGDERE